MGHKLKHTKWMQRVIRERIHNHPLPQMDRVETEYQQKKKCEKRDRKDWEEEGKVIDLSHLLERRSANFRCCTGQTRRLSTGGDSGSLYPGEWMPMGRRATNRATDVSPKLQQKGMQAKKKISP